MRTDGELSPEVFKKKANDVQNKMDAITSDIEELKKREEQRVTKVEYTNRLDLICKRLEEMIDFRKYSDIIPSSIVEAFVERIVFYEDHFEWYLRVGAAERNEYPDSWWSEIIRSGKLYGITGTPDSDIRHIVDSEDERDFRVKVAELVIDKNYAREFLNNTQMGHHFKLSMWKDIKVSIFV